MKQFKAGILSPDAQDALREIGNVGVGQASIALGKMLNVEISISVPEIIQVKKDALRYTFSDGNKVNMGILMKMENTFGGVVLFIVDKDFVSDIIFKCVGKRLRENEILEDEDGLSATKEIANIMASSYIKAIGAYTGIRLYLSPAMVDINDTNSLIDYTLSHFNNGCGTVNCINTGFGLPDGAGNKREPGRIIMIPDDTSVEKILKIVGVI